MFKNLFKKRVKANAQKVEVEQPVAEETAQLSVEDRSEMADLQELMAFEEKIQSRIEKQPEITPAANIEILIEEQRKRDALKLKNPFRGT